MGLEGPFWPRWCPLNGHTGTNFRPEKIKKNVAFFFAPVCVVSCGFVENGAFFFLVFGP